MGKILFSLIILSSSCAFSNTVTCDAITDSQTRKVQISYNSRQIETIDLFRNSLDEVDARRIYSRTNSDTSNRGGYMVSYCNPDQNEVSEYSGLYLYSRCKAANSSDDVFFSFSLSKDYLKGKISISYLGRDVLTEDFVLQSCK